MTTRIGTTASYTLYRSQMSSIQSKINDLSYQSVTGERYSSYDRYGLSTYRLVTLENEQKVVDQYLENNEITKINLEAMQSSVDSIRSILLEFQSTLTAFYSNDLENMDTQEGITEIANLQESAYEAMSQVAYFLNTQVDGVYVFGGGDNTQPPVKFPYNSLEEFQTYYDGNMLTYPTDITALLSDIETADNVTGGLTFTQNMAKSDTTMKQSLVFDTVKNDDGTLTSTLKAAAGTFSGMSAGDRLTVGGTQSVNIGQFEIASVSEDGSTVTFAAGSVIADEIIDPDTARDAGKVTLTQNRTAKTTTDLPVGSISNDPPQSVLRAYGGSYADFSVGDSFDLDGTTYTVVSKNVRNQHMTVTPVFTSGTGTHQVTFNPPKTVADIPVNMTTATAAAFDFSTETNADGTQSAILTGASGAFSNLQSGDEIEIVGTADNDGTYFVKSVSLDGSKITFSDGTTVVDETLNADTPNFDAIEIKQRTLTGTIAAMDSDGYPIEDWTVDAAHLTATLNADGTTTVDTDHAYDFENIAAGQSITIGTETVYVKNVTTDPLTNTASLTLSADTPLTLPLPVAGDIAFSSLSDVHGFVSDVIKGSEGLTGNISLNVAKNQITSTVTDAFSSVKAGDTVVLKGADGNNGVYYVDSVGADGRSMTFSEKTALKKDDVIQNGTGVSLGITYPVGSTLDVSKVDPSYNGSYTITGVSADGNTLTVKTDRFTEAGKSFAATGVQSVKTASYYQGDSLENTVRVGAQTTVKLDIDASESAFATIFNALGQVAQGNLIDLRDEESTLDTVDVTRVETRVRAALDLITEALSSYSASDTYSNITNIQYAIVSKASRLQNTTKAQQQLSDSLTMYISNIKNVDQTEAVTQLLAEKKNLSASYQVFSTINDLSLLNYM